MGNKAENELNGEQQTRTKDIIALVTERAVELVKGNKGRNVLPRLVVHL